MTDWASEVLKRKRPQVTKNTLEYTEQITPYKLLLADEGWEKLSWNVVKNLTLMQLCTGPYLFKMEAGYFCGNKDVWDKLADKDNRLWLKDLIVSMIQPYANRNATLTQLINETWQGFLCVIWAMKYLKATLVSPKGE